MATISTTSQIYTLREDPIELFGVGTAWTSGTIFTLSGLPDAVIVNSSVVSATEASLSMFCPSAGSLTITEPGGGSLTITIAPVAKGTIINDISGRELYQSNSTPVPQE